MSADNRIGVAPPGFRLPDAAHVGRVRLQVSELEQSIAYYERVLGLEATKHDSGRASLASRDGSVLLELLERPGARPVPRRGLRGLYHFAVLLPDRKSLAKFVLHLAQIGERAGMSDHLVSEAVYLSDPDGLGIEVYADRPRETWKAVDGQMTMATAPLNVQDLVKDANGEKWDGAPPGTTMGHVHFYVGDIDEAERFYHEGLGFDKIVWNYPGALFMSAGGYHHHVGTNTWAAGAPAATEDDAKLLDWELVLPGEGDVEAAARSVQAAGFEIDRADGGTYASDQQGIRVRLVAA
jgi:catechol 2,3-dioxygenase